MLLNGDHRNAQARCRGVIYTHMFGAFLEQEHSRRGSVVS